jgi:uncharacterized membrane protein
MKSRARAVIQTGGKADGCEYAYSGGHALAPGLLVSGSAPGDRARPLPPTGAIAKATEFSLDPPSLTVSYPPMPLCGAVRVSFYQKRDRAPRRRPQYFRYLNPRIVFSQDWPRSRAAVASRAATKSETTLMNDLLVIAFSSEQKAEDVRQKLFQMQKEYLIELGDAVVAVKDPDGHVKLNQLFNTTAIGGVSGMFWGALIGLIFMMPLAGAALGAASGAVSGALTDFGIDDKFMKDIAEAVPPGGAALFVLVRKMTTDKVLEGLKGVGGTVLRTSFDKSKDDAIRAALAAQTPTA